MHNLSWLIILFSLVVGIHNNCAWASQKQYQQLTVDVVADEEEIETALTNNLTIVKATKEPKLSVSRIENLHALATTELIETLEALGYYAAEITPQLNNTENIWHASYTITAGRPIVISSISLKVTNLIDKQALRKKLCTPKLKQGDILRHADYEDTKQNLIIALQEHGYLTAKFTTNEINLDKETHSASINLVLDAGKQYVFGKVQFIDCSYSPELLDRFVSFQPGEPYTSKALAKFRKNLNDSAMFKKIKIAPKPNLIAANNNVVPIKVYLKNSPRNHYVGSIGYGTNTGIRGGVGWQHRYLPSGHQISNSLSVSKIRRQANINYSIPGKNPGSDRYIIGAGIQQDTIRDQYSKQKELSVTKRAKQDNIQRFYSLKYVHEDFRLAREMPLEKTKFLLPGAKWIWSKPADDAETFTHGTRLEVNIQGGLGTLLSETDFIQTDILGKWIAPINQATRFIVVGNIGVTAIKNFHELPLSLRFFAGGDKSVRGFAYHSIGPTIIDNAGNTVVTGGKYLLATTLELERKIYSELSAAVFVDTGNAMNTWNSRFASGAGAGIRWSTPIGSFKLDIAKQIAQIQNNKVRIHLNFGTDL